MRKLLFTVAMCSLIVNMADSQTWYTYSRRDTLESSTTWYRFYMPRLSAVRDYSYGIIPKTQTADIRVAFSRRDTAAPKTRVPADLAIVDGANGYVVGDILMVVPNTGTDTLKITVADTTGAGVISDFTITQRGSGYTTGTKNLVGGTGDSATISISRVQNAAAGWFYIPFISGVTPSWNVVRVQYDADTVFIKSDSATVIYHGKW